MRAAFAFQKNPAKKSRMMEMIVCCLILHREGKQPLNNTKFRVHKPFSSILICKEDLFA